MKSPLCIVLCLCSALMACNGEDPEASPWRDVPARLTGAEWKQYKRPTTPRTECDDAVVNSRDEALDLLSAAEGPCLDTALRGVQRLAKEDLAAAYLTRFDRNHDPQDLLRALETAQGFNRALAQEWLGLTREAIDSWDEAAKEDSGWGREAARKRDRLQQRPDPLREWNPKAIADALMRRDAPALRSMVRAFPTIVARMFESTILRDRQQARLLATALAAAGERYPMAVVDAMEHPKDAQALEGGLAALRKKNYARAVTLLERAGNPLSLAVRYDLAVSSPSNTLALRALDPVLPHLRPDYRELSSRVYMWRANLLEFENRYLEAHADYEQAMKFADGEPTLKAAILGRRSTNFARIGDADHAFRDAYGAVSLLPHVADTNARNTAFASAAIAARQLGYPRIALQYQDAAVESTERSVRAAVAETLGRTKLELVAALRFHAEIEVELGLDASQDLTQAADLTEAVDKPVDRDLFRMRIHEVRGQALLKTSPAAAAAEFGKALALATKQDSSYRAMLHFKRAAARREAGDRQADDDIATAMTILRDEVRGALAASPEAASKPLWEPYFLRFREMYHELIASRIAGGDVDGAFVYDELARAFEPMQILLQSRSGFQPIETVADLRRACADLPDDTAILQYLVLPERTYAWVVTHQGVRLVPQRATRDLVERRVAAVAAAVAGSQPDPYKNAMRSVYGELFRAPLAEVGPSKTRIVIVPDQPMHGLPFNGLAGTVDEGYLIDRASIAVAGSTSLYLYALERDRQLSKDHNPAVLLVGDPAFPSKDFPRLAHAREEVEELARDDYPNAEMLTDTAATVENFLTKARSATIIHFAGHALADPQAPWQSRLLLAPQGERSGELSAETLMRRLPSLERTRLVLLGACSTAGGAPIGPQGLAPLVRPFIGANVPAVVGSLWDVGDASTKQLLVSLHCHYRHGDDVAEALRKAQIERLRQQDTEPITAMHWAAFQVTGYAGSPYPPPIALENSDSEHVCTQNPLHRPDGLHPQ